MEKRYILNLVLAFTIGCLAMNGFHLLKNQEVLKKNRISLVRDYDSISKNHDALLIKVKKLSKNQHVK